MAWPKGKKRGYKTPGSGRKPGNANKRTLEFHEALEALDCSIPDVIKGLVEDPAFDRLAKAEFIVKIMPFLWPQRKPIESDAYVSISQVGIVLTAQAQKFTELLVELGHDPEVARRAITNGHQPVSPS